MLLAFVPFVLILMIGVAISRSRRAARAAGLRNAGQAGFVEAMEEGARLTSLAEKQRAYDKAADLALRHFGRFSHERHQAMMLAAEAYAEADEAQPATARLEAAIAIDRRLGADPLVLADALCWLSLLHPNNDAAYRAASEALALSRRALGKADPLHLNLGLTVAPVMARSGHGVEAEALFRAALEVDPQADPSLARRARLDFITFLETGDRADEAERLRDEVKALG